MPDEEKLTPPDLPGAAPSGPDFKITTGEGAPPAAPTFPVIPPSPAGPDFLSPETFTPTPVPPGVEKNKGLLKTVLIALGAVIFVGGLGALSYFVVYPIVFAPETEKPGPIEPKPIAEHRSFLTVPASSQSEINLSNRGYLTIATALQNESFNQLADGQFKEVKISDANGQVPFADYLAAVLPAASALDRNWFQEDFTAVLYYDATGVWPVYVGKLMTKVDPSRVMGEMQILEPIMEFSNLYLTPPGTFSTFKTGKAGNYSTRYAVGTQMGAAFNYGVLGNYLILSTNYNGLKGVLPLLGL